ncbi:MAG: hypothetical protein EHM27_14840 [Deltaproteobacteria bacterium]|nr:MAG: hypothetical protein EHM27_14840 [Deltaproteobacteria bacterium]
MDVKVRDFPEVEHRTAEQIRKRWGDGKLKESAPKVSEDGRKKAEDAIDGIFRVRKPEPKKSASKKSKKKVLSSLSEDVKGLQEKLRGKKIRLSNLDALETKVSSVALRESSVDWDGVLKLVDEYTAEKITALELVENLPRYGWTF